MNTVLNIEGMSCDHCARHVTEALKDLNGVRSVQVSLKSNTASVDHAENVTLAAMKAAVEDAGYEVVNAAFQV